MSIHVALSAKLKLRESSAAWDVWEHKTFNIHRGVWHWRILQQPLQFNTMQAAVEQQVKQSFRVAW